MHYNPYEMIGAQVEYAGSRRGHLDGTGTTSGNNTSAILNSISSLVDSLGGLFGKKNTTQTVAADPADNVKKNNTAVYVLGGVLFLLLIAIIFWLVKKKRK